MVTKTAIVFSGGGSLGAVQVGMLRALVEANLRYGGGGHMNAEREVRLNAAKKHRKMKAIL
jgi:hypothetical protein